MGVENQTISYLTQVFAETGIRPDTRHGQNFLVDPNLQRLIVRRANIESRDVVLEVGTGTGSLTVLLAEAAGAVVTVEIDYHLFELAAEALQSRANVIMLRQDALKNKNRLDARLLDTVSEMLAVDPQRRLKLVANLPFNVATPVISNLLCGPRVPHSMTVTIQKEMADRILANPNTRAYGSLSVWMQSQCHTELVRVLPPSVFWPQPKVMSAIIQIHVDDVRRSQIPDLEYFHHFARGIFFHRRKYLRSSMLGTFKRWLAKSDVDAVLREMQFGPEVRAEQLDVATVLTLCEAVRARAPEWRL